MYLQVGTRRLGARGWRAWFAGPHGWPSASGACPKMDSGGTPVKLSMLMCAYNEERTIIQAISEVLAEDYPCDMELIVVDDGSTDATPTLLAHVNDPRVIIHRHPRNRGKGASLLSAVSIATGTHILPFDADLEYAPEDIIRIIHPVLKGRCDVVYGVRIFGFNTVYHSYRYATGKPATDPNGEHSFQFIYK